MNIMGSKASWVRLGFVASLSLAAACGDDGTSSGSGGSGSGAGGQAQGGGGADSVGGAGGAGAAGGQGGAAQGGAAQGGNGGAVNGGGGAGTGGAAPSGDCSDLTDCPEGSDCVELTPGGFRVCTTPVPEAISCESDFDACCTTADCAAPGQCFNTESVPSCGGIQPAPSNQCFFDTCTDDIDCGTGVCLPAQTFRQPVRACAQAFCRVDADCATGTCAPVINPCCGALSGLACVEDGGCRDSADCPPDSYCDINQNTGMTECFAGQPICPL